MEIKRNVVALVERNQKKCGGGGGWWWWRENNRNVVAVYSFTIYEAVLKKVECGVDVGSI